MPATVLTLSCHCGADPVTDTGLRTRSRPEPNRLGARRTGMTTAQRRSLAATTAVLLALVAALIVLPGTTAAPAGRILSAAGQHHVTVPSPFRTSAFQHGSPVGDVAVLSPVILLGLGLLALVRRRPLRARLSSAVISRSSARGPPTLG